MKASEVEILIIILSLQVCYVKKIKYRAFLAFYFLSCCTVFSARLTQQLCDTTLR